MIVNSGIVLDFVTNTGIEGVMVYALSPSQDTILASGVTDLDGGFSLTLSDSLVGDLFYVPFLTGYIGYNKTFKPDISFIDLYLRASSAIPAVSGVGFCNLVGAPLSTSTNIKQIYASPSHLYVATDGGLDIIDINTLENTAYVVFSGGFTCVNANQHRYVSYRPEVLVGTLSSGVFALQIQDSYPQRNQTQNLQRRYSVEQGNLLSNSVQCLQQNVNRVTAVGTSGGIDVFSGVNHYKFSYPVAEETKSCFVSTSGDIYYSPTGSGLYVKYGPITADWTTEDYRVTLSGSGDHPFPLLTNYINEIEVTSVSGAGTNHVFLATESGILAYTENVDLNESASEARLLLESENISSLHIDLGTTPNTHHILFSTSGVVGDYNLENSVVTYFDNFFDINLKRAGIIISGSRTIGRV